VVKFREGEVGLQDMDSPRERKQVIMLDQLKTKEIEEENYRR